MDEPDVASIAALVGDPARSRILLALMGGRALTATELALEARVTPQTASAHLSKLCATGLLSASRQGRHRYFQLADASVAELLESLCNVAGKSGASRVRTGPRDPAMRDARVCYDHLAGDWGVRLYESLLQHDRLSVRDAEPQLTSSGEAFFDAFGVDLRALERSRRPVCRRCLDWSVRRHHLAGGLGAAMLDRIFARRWARRHPSSRAVIFTARGLDELARAFRCGAAASATR
jgi:DNA-binding transcriptional ArsR family regulator